MIDDIWKEYNIIDNAKDETKTSPDCDSKFEKNGKAVTFESKEIATQASSNVLKVNIECQTTDQKDKHSPSPLPSPLPKCYEELRCELKDSMRKGVQLKVRLKLIRLLYIIMNKRKYGRIIDLAYDLLLFITFFDSSDTPRSKRFC